MSSAGRAEQASKRLLDLTEMVERALIATLPADRAAADDVFGQARLVEAMRYSLATPGKRLRPLLALTAAEATGGDPAPLARFAAGIEMIHAYSLIHDDLPAMDDDDLRRGVATNHVVYGDGMAILAGDGLLTQGLVVLLEPVADAAVQMSVVSELARAAGYEGMVGGQAADLLAERMEPEEALLRSIHARKTGALIHASVRAGALLSRATDTQLDTLDRFSAHYGLAFQIADDVKDEIAPAAVTGKLPGGDRAAGKMTYPALCGIDGARERLVAELDSAVTTLAELGEAADALELLARESVRVAFADDGGTT